MIEIGTTYIREDEPCFCLTERDLPSPLGERRRYRDYVVVRNDRLATHRVDLGLSKDIKTDQIRIPGGVIDEQTKKIFIEHTVGELIDIAQELRLRPTFDKHELTGLEKIK